MDTQTTDNTAVFQRLDRTARRPYARGEYARRVIWNIIQATLFRLPLPVIGYAWRRTLLRMHGAKLANHAGVQRRVTIFHPWLFELGDWSMISNGVIVYNLGPVRIGSHSVISQDAYICAGTHDYTRADLPLERPSIVIGDGVWIAAAAFVGPGISIGTNSVIGARAVVVSDIPPDVVAAGNPARVIKPRPMENPQ